MAETSQALYRAGSGEPLLLLHGFTGTWHHWRPLLGELAARYEVVAPTLHGHDGGPPFPVGAAFTPAGATDVLERDLDELGLESVHVVGNSMGGAFALELAKRGRARSVVAIAPGGGWSEGDGEAQRLARFFSRQIRMTRTFAPHVGRIMRRPGIRRFAMREVMRHGELLAPADAVDLVRAVLGCTVAEQTVNALRADRELALRDLDQIGCPVLLLSPEFDRVLPADRHAVRLRREIPGVEWRALPGCGHVPMWDDTRLVLSEICQFVERHSARKPSAPAEAHAL